MKLFENIRDRRLYDKVIELAELFRSSGGRALLVGGAVRDALRGQEIKDIDLEIHGLPPEKVRSLLESVCEVDAVGMSFGVLKVKHLELDVSLPRKENKTGAGHRGFLIEPDPDLSYADAAARRDFTVNAIMYDPLTEEIIDPHNGTSDLQKGILRHVSSHFSEDPLRVLRGMQFAARMEFTAAEETLQLCRSLDQRELARERIGTEWEKLLLQSRYPSIGLEFLFQCGWSRFYPELTAGNKEEMAHFADRMAALRSGNRDDDLILMITSLGIFMTSEDEISAFFHRMWNREEILASVLRHRQVCLETAENKSILSDSELRHLAVKLDGMKIITSLLAEKTAGKELEERCTALGIWDSAPEPLLTGRHGIELGLTPGPELGRVLKVCFEAQLNGEFADLGSGRSYLKKLLNG